MLSHTRMGVPYEYTHMGRPIRVWANIRIWGRTLSLTLHQLKCSYLLKQIVKYVCKNKAKD